MLEASATVRRTSKIDPLPAARIPNWIADIAAE